VNKKTINIFGTFFIFLIGFIIHNLYELFPNFITIILAPVNESIFEHLKMIFTSYMIWIIIKRSILKNKDIKENNFLFLESLTALFNILIFLIIFIPIYNYFGENLTLTLVIYFVTIALSQTINYFIELKKDYKSLNILSFIAIILIYISTTYLTYNPPKTELFLDPINNSYGLNK